MTPVSRLLAAVRSVLGMVALLALVSVGVFALVRSAPGDPVRIQLGEVSALGASAAQVREIRAAQEARLGLDGSLPEQYLRWLGRVLGGDFGTSYYSQRPVLDELLVRLPASLVLGGCAFLVGLLLALGLALLVSARPGGAADHVVRLAGIAAAAVPTFLLGLLALQFFARDPNDYAITGAATPDRLWLPALVLGVAITPQMLRLLRASLITERNRPYAVAAVSRGTGTANLMLRHVFRPATSPVLTLIGLSLGSLVVGSVITEAVFAWPGIGAFAVSSIEARDYPVVQGYVLLVTVLVLLINRLVELVQHRLDPRVAQRTEAEW